MPLPLLAWVAIGATGLFGAGKTIGAMVDNSDAKDINSEANRIVEDAKGVINASRSASGKALEALGSKKAHVAAGSMSNFLKVFKQIKNLELRDYGNFFEFGKFKTDRQSLEELQGMCDFASDLIGGSLVGSAAGALTAYGAYSGAMAFGAASTGTAISALSGAAASNATLAFLGGGSLAAGGAGIAGGAMVLGGLVAAPALAVLGLFMGSSAKTNLENAKSNRAEARKFAEEMKTAAVKCDAIRDRAYLFASILTGLDTRLIRATGALQDVINNRGADFRNFKPKDKETAAASYALAQAVKTVLNTPILTENGELTSNSLSIAQSVQRQYALV